MVINFRNIVIPPAAFAYYTFSCYSVTRFAASSVVVSCDATSTPCRTQMTLSSVHSSHSTHAHTPWHGRYFFCSRTCGGGSVGDKAIRRC